MDDTSLMKRFQAEHDLCDIIPCPFLWEITKRLDEGSAIAPIQILHDQVQVLLALESEIELRNERRLGLLHQNHTLSLHVRDLILRNHVGLLQDLDGKVVARDFLLCQEDGAESTLADRFDDLEILD